VLTGDGGDELLAGYDFWYRRYGRWNTVALSESAVGLLWHTSRALSGLRLQTPNSWQQVMQGAALKREFASIADAHRKQQEVFSCDDLRLLGMNGADLPLSSVKLKRLPAQWMTPCAWT